MRRGGQRKRCTCRPRGTDTERQQIGLLCALMGCWMRANLLPLAAASRSASRGVMLTFILQQAEQPERHATCEDAALASSSIIRNTLPSFDFGDAFSAAMSAAMRSSRCARRGSSSLMKAVARSAEVRRASSSRLRSSSSGRLIGEHPETSAKPSSPASPASPRKPARPSAAAPQSCCEPPAPR